MHRPVRWALPALLVALPLSAPAEGELPFRIGFGGSIDVASFTMSGEMSESSMVFVPGDFTNVSVPIWIGDLRLEPHFGWTNYDFEIERTFDGEKQTQRFATDAFRIGTSVAWSWKVAERTRLYAGPQFGLIFRETETEFPEFIFPGNERAQVTETTTATDFWIGATLGGEAFLTDAFSLGLEAQLNYVSFGEPELKTKISPAPEPEPEPDPGAPRLRTERSESLWTTNLALFARFYFM